MSGGRLEMGGGVKGDRTEFDVVDGRFAGGRLSPSSLSWRIRMGQRVWSRMRWGEYLLRRHDGVSAGESLCEG